MRAGKDLRVEPTSQLRASSVLLCLWCDKLVGPEEATSTSREEKVGERRVRGEERPLLLIFDARTIGCVEARIPPLAWCFTGEVGGKMN